MANSWHQSLTLTSGKPDCYAQVYPFVECRPSISKCFYPLHLDSLGSALGELLLMGEIKLSRVSPCLQHEVKEKYVAHCQVTCRKYTHLYSLAARLSGFSPLWVIFLVSVFFFVSTLACTHCLCYHLVSLIITCWYKAALYRRCWGEDGFGLNGHGRF